MLRPARVRVLLLLTALASSAFLVLAKPSVAFTPQSCTFDATTHVATVDPGDEPSVTISRSGSALTMDGSPCESATVEPLGGAHTVETVKVHGFATDGTSLTFDLSNGPFAPGFTAEGGESDEIEFQVRSTRRTSIFVHGSTSDDDISAGDRGRRGTTTFRTILNFNQATDLGWDLPPPEGSPVDDDVTIRGEVSFFDFIGGAGVDVLSARGTGAVGSRPSKQEFVYVDGSGHDAVYGGNGRDEILPPNPPDEGDLYVGGAGSDVILYGRNRRVSVTLDDVDNDGSGCPSSCEHDQVSSDIEAIVTGDGNDRIVGGAGHQLIDPGNGRNTVFGGEGNDLISPSGTGPDVIHGGKGGDTVAYDIHGLITPGGVHVTLDGHANDGLPNEHDNVEPDVENVKGTDEDDLLVGNARKNRLTGGKGQDMLRSLGGDDVLMPGPGPDTASGGAGRDTVSFAGAAGAVTASLSRQQSRGDGLDTLVGIERLTGSAHADRLTGSAAANVLTGGAGNDVLRGLAGNDRLLGGSGNDALDGGAGMDTCSQGPGSGTKTSCEH